MIVFIRMLLLYWHIKVIQLPVIGFLFGIVIKGFYLVF
jgi:hypothetical protein